MGAEHLAQLLEDTSIDVGPLGDVLQRRVDASLASWTGMARQLEWLRYRDAKLKHRQQCGDGSRLKRAVGKAPYQVKSGPRRGEILYQTRITFELAEFICHRLDIDMIEVGL